MTGVDDCAAIARRTHQETGDGFDRRLGCRQADAVEASTDERRQALDRDRQVAAPLVAGDRMDLVDDDRPSGFQHRAAGLRAEQQIKRFRRRDENMRRPAAHLLALAGGGVAGAHRGADLELGRALFAQCRANAAQRRVEIALDVVRQRLQRRDVDDLGFVAELTGRPLADQRVDRGEKRRQRLARAGRRRNQHVAAGLDGRPSGVLSRGRRREAAQEPCGDGGMERGDR